MSDPTETDAFEMWRCRRCRVVAPVIVVWIVLTVALSMGCKSDATPPTETECQQAIDHLLDLWAAADPEAAGNRAKLDPMMPGLVNVCQKKYSSKKVKCLIAAGSKVEADGCTD